MGEKKKSLLEQKIEQFCSTSGELLADIHARYNGKNNGDNGKSKGRKKTKKIISMEDLKVDFVDDEPLEDI